MTRTLDLSTFVEPELITDSVDAIHSLGGAIASVAGKAKASRKRLNGPEMFPQGQSFVIGSIVVGGVYMKILRHFDIRLNEVMYTVQSSVGGVANWTESACSSDRR